MSRSPESGETPNTSPFRRTLPRLSSRPFKTLAPKPFQTDRPISNGRATARAPSLVAGPWNCPICPVFQRPACRLRSHKAFAKAPKRAPQAGNGTIPTQSHRPAENDAAYAHSYAYRFAQSFVDSDIAAGRVDPFYKLPIPDSTHPQIHRLFHDCKHAPPLQERRLLARSHPNTPVCQFSPCSSIVPSLSHVRHASRAIPLAAFLRRPQ